MPMNTTTSPVSASAPASSSPSPPLTAVFAEARPRSTGTAHEQHPHEQEQTQPFASTPTPTPTPTATASTAADPLSTSTPVLTPAPALVARPSVHGRRLTFSRFPLLRKGSRELARTPSYSKTSTSAPPSLPQSLLPSSLTPRASITTLRGSSALSLSPVDGHEAHAAEEVDNSTNAAPAPRKTKSDKMHQTSSRLLRMTDDERPYTRVCHSPFYAATRFLQHGNAGGSENEGKRRKPSSLLDIWPAIAAEPTPRMPIVAGNLQSHADFNPRTSRTCSPRSWSLCRSLRTVSVSA